MKCTWRQCFNNALFSLHEFGTGKYLNRSCGRHLTVACLAVNGPVTLKPMPTDPIQGIPRTMPKRLRRYVRRQTMRRAP